MVKILLSIVVLVTILASEAGSLSGQQKCRGGSWDFWRVQCNWCRCRNYRPDCERNTCASGLLSAYECTGECVGNSVWKKDCNTCRCVDGRASCTEKLCNPPVTCSQLQRAKCPEYRMIDYMLVKGCKPVYPNPRRGCCATHFSCPSEPAQPSEENCIYQGKLVSRGFRLSKNVGCRFGCTCSPPRFICAIPGCAPPPQLEPGCYRTHRLNGCCPAGVKCDKDNPAQCPWKGQQFKEGQRMSFRQPGYFCQQCICSKDWKNPFGPQCQKIDCGYDLNLTTQQRIVRGCVPVFAEDRCCPWQFICPGDEKVNQVQDDAVTSGRRVCQFGDFKIPVGKQLSLTDESATCRCVTPPDVTCIARSDPR